MALWEFASSTRENINEIVESMEANGPEHTVVEEEAPPVVEEAPTEDIVTDALDEVSQIVETLEGFILRGDAPSVGELQVIIGMTRRIEQLLNPVLQPRLLSGSLAVLCGFTRLCFVPQTHAFLQV